MQSGHTRQPTTYPKHHRSSSDKVIHPTIDVEKEKARDIDDVIGERKEILKQHYDLYKNKSTLFVPAKTEETQHDIQTVNVTVNVNEQQDDCCTTCFSSLAKCFGIR